jgi:hypothetical protein
MGFRVLVAGGRHFTDYHLLRATLDVELLTPGGPGVPMQAASYAAVVVWADRDPDVSRVLALVQSARPRTVRSRRAFVRAKT